MESVWYAMIAALATWERAHEGAVRSQDVLRSDFDESGELRRITVQVDPHYKCGDGDCGDAAVDETRKVKPGRFPLPKQHVTARFLTVQATIQGTGIEDGALNDDGGIGYDPIAGFDTTGAFLSPARRSEQGSYSEAPIRYDATSVPMRMASNAGSVTREGVEGPTGIWGHRAAGVDRWSHERDVYLAHQRDNEQEPTGFAENPKATYLWRQGRSRKERAYKMRQIIAHGSMRRVLKARAGIKKARNESICATLGITLPERGSWPGVESLPGIGMVRRYHDAALGATVTRYPDWSSVWLTKAQLSNLMGAIELRMDGKPNPGAKPVLDEPSEAVDWTAVLAESLYATL